MTKYTDIVYRNTNKEYDYKLCEYLYNKYFSIGGNILDVGCSNGRHMRIFDSLGLQTWGLDIRQEDKRNDRIKICDIEKESFPFKDNTFRFIFCKSLIEHLHRPDNFLNECYRVLQPNGIILIMTPDWKSQMNFFWDDYSHYHPYTKTSLKDVLSIFGFKDSSCDYILQLPFVWKHPKLSFIPKIISLLPDSTKWKTREMRNGEIRKLIRFSKEKMLIGVARK